MFNPETRPPFCARGGGQKEASLRGARPGEVARKHRQRRGGRGGAAGDQVVVVRGGGMRTSRVAHAAADHLPTLVNQPSHFPPHWTIPVFLPPFGRRNAQEKRSLFWDEGRLRESCELRWSPSTNKRGGATKKKTKISDIKKITSAATKTGARRMCQQRRRRRPVFLFIFTKTLPECIHPCVHIRGDVFLFVWSTQEVAMLSAGEGTKL